MGKKGDHPGQTLRKPNWDLSRLMPFQKNFYVETATVAMRTEVYKLLFVTLRRISFIVTVYTIMRHAHRCGINSSHTIDTLHVTLFNRYK